MPYKKNLVTLMINCNTLESGIDLGQGINVGPGKFVKKIILGNAQKVAKPQEMLFNSNGIQLNLKS